MQPLCSLEASNYIYNQVFRNNCYFVNYTYVWIYEKGAKQVDPITHISLWFHYSSKPPLSHGKGQKIEKGRQWKEDKRV